MPFTLYVLYTKFLSLFQPQSFVKHHTTPPPPQITASYVVQKNSEQSTDDFGSALALSGNGQRAVVSNALESIENITHGGAVYLYGKCSTQWKQEAQLLPDDTCKNGRFGTAVAISADGNTVAIGSTGAVQGRFNKTGAVYIFVRTYKGEWLLDQKIAPQSEKTILSFGASVALSADGATVLIGCDEPDTHAVAFLFTRDVAWRQSAVLRCPLNVKTRYYFGRYVALSGSGLVAAVSAIGESSEQLEEAGAVYVFEHTCDWDTPKRITAVNKKAFSYFGSALALNAAGDRLAIGSLNESKKEDAGCIEVYEKSADGWRVSSILYDPFGEPGDQFGSAIALSAIGDVLIVGGYNTNTCLSCDYGAVYVFKEVGGDWSITAELISQETVDKSWFGYSLALSADASTAIVGSHMFVKKWYQYEGLFELFLLETPDQQ